MAEGESGLIHILRIKDELLPKLMAYTPAGVESGIEIDFPTDSLVVRAKTANKELGFAITAASILDNRYQNEFDLNVALLMKLVQDEGGSFSDCKPHE